MEETRKHNLGLKRDDNEEYYKIVNIFNTTGRKITFINERILKIKTPKIFLFCHKFKIKSYSKYLLKLQKLVDEWGEYYNNFVQKPSLTFSGTEERFIGFLHYMRLLEQMDIKLNRHYDTTVANFIKVQEKYGNQINFLIAIISAYVSLIGLILSLVALKLI